MQSISTELKNHLQDGVTTMATCWRLLRRDGVVMGFTTHDVSIQFDGLVYLATTGFTPSMITGNNAMNVDNLDVSGVLSSEMISSSDLIAGVFDYARIEIFLINWEDPSQGKLVLRSGTLGEISVQDSSFQCEVRGMTQVLQQNFGQVYSPECRAHLGDELCTVGMAAHTHFGSVTSVVDQYQFRDSELLQADGWFDYGVVSWLSGNNAGRRMEVRSFASTKITLFSAMSSPIVIGDKFRIVAGCDKAFSTCKAKFANAVNFQGEPFIPGSDEMYDYPGLV